MQAEIEERLFSEFPDARLTVELDGNRALIDIAHDKFGELNRVQRQQAVYACIEDYIADGRLHAVTIRASESG